VRDFGMPTDLLDADVDLNRLMIYYLFDASKGSKANFEVYRTCPQYADEVPNQIGLSVTGRCVGRVKKVYAVARAGSAAKQVDQWNKTLKQWIHTSGVH
jgi:hypothetical protein